MVRPSRRTLNGRAEHAAPDPAPPVGACTLLPGGLSGKQLGRAAD